jgi:cytidylate kinase
MARRDGIVVAIDGPAGSGKSSTAQAVAADLGYRHLDSGAFYRAITLAALNRGIAPERWNSLTLRDLDSFAIEAKPVRKGYSLAIGGEGVEDEIRTSQVNANVSAMAAVPIVREWLLGVLRETGEQGGLVADGRDIGTVVFPDAELKIFLVCEPEERAVRRLREIGIDHPSPEEVENESIRLQERDRLDRTRSVAPLRRADDAVVLDTTGLAFDAQVRVITQLARAAMGR